MFGFLGIVGGNFHHLKTLKQNKIRISIRGERFLLHNSTHDNLLLLCQQLLMIRLDIFLDFVHPMQMFFFIELFLFELGNLLRENGLEIDRTEVRMGFQIRKHQPFFLIGTKSLLGNLHQQFSNQIHCLLCYVLVRGKAKLHIFYLLEHLELVSCLEGCFQIIHLIDDTSQCPQIRRCLADVKL